MLHRAPLKSNETNYGALEISTRCFRWIRRVALCPLVVQTIKSCPQKRPCPVGSSIAVFFRGGPRWPRSHPVRSPPREWGQTSERIRNLLSHFDSLVVGLSHAKRPGAMAEVANDAQGHRYAEQDQLQQDFFPILLPPPLSLPPPPSHLSLSLSLSLSVSLSVSLSTPPSFSLSLPLTPSSLSQCLLSLPFV